MLHAPQLIEDGGNISEAKAVWLDDGHFESQLWLSGEYR